MIVLFSKIGERLGSIFLVHEDEETLRRFDCVAFNFMQPRRLCAPNDGMVQEGRHFLLVPISAPHGQIGARVEGATIAVMESHPRITFIPCVDLIQRLTGKVIEA